MLNALENLLDESEVGEVETILGKTAFSGAVELRNTLRKHGSTTLGNSSQESVNRNVGKIMSTTQLTPWASSCIPSKLPTLPAVFDPTLEVAAFTHHGYGTGNVSALSYERLEWIGDAYIYATSTLLISQTFPALLPGKCSQLREQLVKNVTLADYARKYGFEKRAKLPPHLSGDSQYGMKDQDKIMGDIFEAYVAAVVLSDPENGVSRASEWLKSLWAMTLSKEIKQEDRNVNKLDSPLWRLRGAVGDVETRAVTAVELNAKEKLQMALSSKVSKLSYKDLGPPKKDPNNKLAVFTVGVFLTGWGEFDKQIGFGSAISKKEAGMKAADMALKNKSTMCKYLEKKKISDALLEREAIALKKQEENNP